MSETQAEEINFLVHKEKPPFSTTAYVYGCIAKDNKFLRYEYKDGVLASYNCHYKSPDAPISDVTVYFDNDGKPTKTEVSYKPDDNKSSKHKHLTVEFADETKISLTMNDNSGQREHQKLTKDSVELSDALSETGKAFEYINQAGKTLEKNRTSGITPVRPTQIYAGLPSNQTSQQSAQ